MSTTLVNAYVGPPIVRYVDRLEEALSSAGFGRELLLATCSGGVATPADVKTRPLVTMSSGPTGGVVAAARSAARVGLGDVVSVDMGGTSYDVCLIREGRPEVTSDWNWRHRYCIALPMVDIHAIGAGGGSLIRAANGGLTVGPESAGSSPGPGLLRQRRLGTDRDRRRPGPGPTRSGLVLEQPLAPGPRRGAPGPVHRRRGHRDECRGDRRGGHRHHRRPHGRRRATSPFPGRSGCPRPRVSSPSGAWGPCMRPASAACSACHGS